ncbi:hypothetical protein [Streptosporangium sp. G11]
MLRIVVFMCQAVPIQREKLTVYKEFAIEAVVWIIPVAVLLGLAFMITA